jgi:hypothetical protein
MGLHRTLIIHTESLAISFSHGLRFVAIAFFIAYETTGCAACTTMRGPIMKNAFLLSISKIDATSKSVLKSQVYKAAR